MLIMIVQPDGSLEEREVEKENSYEAFHEGVKGWIEGHSYAPDLEHYHNEEFLYAEGEVFGQVNLTALLLSGGNVFFGPVVYFGGIDDEGDSVGLTPGRAQIVREQAQIVRENLPFLQGETAHIGKPEPRFTITPL